LVAHANATVGLRDVMRDGPTAHLSANEKHHEMQITGGDRSDPTRSPRRGATRLAASRQPSGATLPPVDLP